MQCVEEHTKPALQIIAPQDKQSACELICILLVYHNQQPMRTAPS